MKSAMTMVKVSNVPHSETCSEMAWSIGFSAQQAGFRSCGANH